MHAASTLVLISCDLSRNFCTCVPHGCQELCTCIVSCSVLTAMQAGGEPFTVACSQEVQGALTGAAELASTSSQEDASEHEAAAAGGSQQAKGMAQSKGRAEASLADAAQHRKRAPEGAHGRAGAGAQPWERHRYKMFQCERRSMQCLL